MTGTKDVEILIFIKRSFEFSFSYTNVKKERVHLQGNVRPVLFERRTTLSLFYRDNYFICSPLYTSLRLIFYTRASDVFLDVDRCFENEKKKKRKRARLIKTGDDGHPWVGRRGYEGKYATGVNRHRENSCRVTIIIWKGNEDNVRKYIL